MNVRIFLLYLLFNCLPQFLSAQNFLSGKVTDATSKAPVELCLVMNGHSGKATYTDGNGYFKLDFTSSNPGSTYLYFSHSEYQADSILVETNKNNYDIFLKPAPIQLEEIVVTGTSRGTLIRENPVSVVGISAKTIQRTIESNVIDALVRNAPGLNAVKTGPNISKPFIRGLGYNRVLTLYDGIRQEGQQWGDEHGIEIDGYSIGRAEVIKGPASIMYGSDALAGVVSFFPEIPTREDTGFHLKYLSEYQSNNGLVGNGFRLGFVKKNWIFAARGALRIARNYRNARDGWVYNTGFDEKNGSFLAGHIGQKGFVHLNLTMYDNHQGIPDGSRDTINYKFTKQVQENDVENYHGRPVVSENELSSYHLSPLQQHIQHRRLYVKGERNMLLGSVQGLLALQQSVRKEFNHPTDLPQPGLFVRLNTLNYGIRYDLARLSQWKISTGISGMFQVNKNLNGTDFPIPNYHLFDIGGFIFSSYKKDKLFVSGGVRYDFRKVTGKDFYVYKDSLTGFEHQGSSFGQGTSLRYAAMDIHFTGISGSLGASYAISDRTTVKANIARGYRAPNVAEFAANGLDPGAKIYYRGNRNFIPEFNLQEDIGIEYHGKQVDLNVSLFNNQISHYIYLSQVVDDSGKPLELVPGNKTYQYLQGTAQLYGLEISLNLTPEQLKGFSFNNNLSYIHGYNRDKRFRDQGLNGEFLPFIPPFKWISSLSKEQKLTMPIIESITVRTEMEFNGAQNRYLALYNTETYTPSYQLFNAGINAGFKELKQKKVQLQFQVNNVFNTVYQSNLSRLKYFGINGMGRNISLRLVASI